MDGVFVIDLLLYSLYNIIYKLNYYFLQTGITTANAC